MTASAAASEATTPVMSLESVTRNYRQGDEIVHALRSTDLELRAGELVGILGPSGSGKSTLLTIMGGLRTPSSGTVTISGQPFSSLPEKQRARLRLRRIGFVLQASGLVPFLRLNDQFSLHDRAARSKGDTDRRDHLLDSLGITKRAHAYPSELSGGERQRAAIAVALYPDPDIILADEPTGNLDPSTSVGIMRLLDRINRQGTTVVMATHDDEIVDQMRKRVIELKGGEVVRDQDRGVYGSDR